jgi:hypothetical protein
LTNYLGVNNETLDTDFVEHVMENYSENTPNGDKLIFRVLLETLNGANLYSISNDSEIFLLIDEDNKFLFTGYETSAINKKDNQIFINGWDNMVIYNTNTKKLAEIATR